VALLWIACGGGAGALARYLLSGWSQALAPGAFPLGTLVVNVAGCLLIGLLGALMSGPLLVREEIRLAVLVGLLGGFTTFSSFAWESFALLNDGQWAQAGLNVLLSNGLGLAAVWLGYRVAERWLGA
jgi:CrcB protein